MPARPQQPLGAPLPGLPNRMVVPRFAPDGAHVFAVYGAGAPAHRGNVRPAAWTRRAGAGQRLTRAERQDS